jgi:outer membrane murein-binding lipoprotein Lpp
MNIGPELLLALVAQVLTGAGVYAAIRADLARALERAHSAKESADKAHTRIDNLMNKGSNHAATH